MLKTQKHTHTHRNPHTHPHTHTHRQTWIHAQTTLTDEVEKKRANAQRQQHAHKTHSATMEGPAHKKVRGKGKERRELKLLTAATAECWL